MKAPPNPEKGLAALKAVELQPEDPKRAFLQALQQYVIYAPSISVLRGVAPETQPKNPFGISGGRLPEAIRELLSERLRRGTPNPIASKPNSWPLFDKTTAQTLT